MTRSDSKQEDQQPAAVSAVGSSSPARGRWKHAIQHVASDTKRDDGDAASPDISATPSIIEERRGTAQPAAKAATPKLAIMVHAVHNQLAGGGSSTNSNTDNTNTTSTNGTSSSLSLATSSDCFYVRAGLHSTHHPLVPLQQRKTALVRPTPPPSSSVVWSDGLLQLEPHGAVEELEVLLQLKRRNRLTRGSVVVGSVRVPLKDVAANPERWGAKQQLELTAGGHKLTAGGEAAGVVVVLEVQMFLSAASAPSPLRVLCASWNVGNSLPPPPEQLQQWLKGAKEGEHHMVAVAAQECNYTKDMRRFVSQQRRTIPSTPGASADGTAAATATTPTAAAAAAAAATAAAGDGSMLQEQDSVASAGTPTATLAPAGGSGAVVLGAGPGAAAGVSGDSMTAASRLGSARAVLKSKLVDAVDSSAMWERHISSALGDKYWMVASKHMFQTRLLLFARADVVPSLSHISTGFEATGIGHVGVNKGGVGIGLRVGSTHIAFLGSHLAAHQSKTPQRNRDVSEICHELDLKQSAAAAGADLVTGFHHVVWMGDLNYRLEYGQQAVTQSDSPTPEDFKSQCELITQQRFDELLPLDQLQRELSAGRVFAGFKEGAITFAPTFKVLKGEPRFAYTGKRSPAWCDRVLFKSALPHKRASCLDYFTAPEICSSDHKPVAAVLELPLATNTVTVSAHTVAASASAPAAGGSSGVSPFSFGAAASPPPATSTSNSRAGGSAGGGSSSSKAVSPSNSWTSTAARLVSRISARRSTTAGSSDATLYKLYVSAVSLGGRETWESLALLADKSKLKKQGKTAAYAVTANTTSSSTSNGASAGVSSTGAAGADGGGGSKVAAGQMQRSSSSGAAGRSSNLKLQLVVSGACMGGLRPEHVMRLNTDAVLAAQTAEQQPSLLLREDSVQLLPGPLNQLTDDWLLVQLVLSEGWRRKQTLARAILPLQPVVAAFRTNSRSVPITLQLESSSVAVGSLVCNVQLISSASIRAGMHEAIRRMRTMAASSRSASLAAKSGSRGGLDKVVDKAAVVASIEGGAGGVGGSAANTAVNGGTPAHSP